jgi:hypothetical protein
MATIRLYAHMFLVVAATHNLRKRERITKDEAEIIDQLRRLHLGPNPPEEWTSLYLDKECSPETHCWDLRQTPPVPGFSWMLGSFPGSQSGRKRTLKIAGIEFLLKVFKKRQQHSLFDSVFISLPSLCVACSLLVECRASALEEIP